MLQQAGDNRKHGIQGKNTALQQVKHQALDGWLQACTSSLPGAEFLRGRVDKCEAIPAAERTADVAAFVEGYRLLDEVCASLPFPPVGAILAEG